MNILKSSARLCAAAVTFCAVLPVFAGPANGGNGGAALIIYEPTSFAVPASGGYVLVALAMLLAVVAFRLLKRPTGERSGFFVMALGVTALATGSGGVKLISDARASLNLLLEFNSGGAYLVPPSDVPVCWTVENAAQVPHAITSIQAQSGYMIGSCVNGGAPVGPAINGGAGTYRGTCDDNPSTKLRPGDFCDLLAVPDGDR
ncbi:MAG: midcut-by-XrtH protein [Chromatiales bacterium]|nr:midcut-by-XrtH protein [Chromatiales bacterium]